MTLKTSIPEQLKTDEFRFIKLREKTKIPKEPDFTKAANFAYDDPALLRHLEKGNNYGILGGQGGFIEIDADHEPLITELKNKLPKTFTVKTPHGGFHKYLKTDDPHTGALLDTIEDVNGDRANLGHVTGYGRQVVGPGCSLIENGKELFYTIEDDAEIAKISWKEVNKIIGVYLVTKKQARENDDQEETKYTFTNEKCQNIMDVIANPDDFTDDGDGRYRGFPIFGSHQKTGYFLVYTKTNTWYSHKDNEIGSIPQLIALQEKIIKPKENLKGEKWWAAIKIMDEKYGIKIKHEETQQPAKSDILLQDAEQDKITDAFYLDERGRRKINYEVLIDNLCTEFVFRAFDDTEELLIHDDGVYRNGITFVKAYLERALGPIANKHLIGEIIAHIQRRSYTPRKEFNTNKKYIPLENGLLNLENFNLETFDPEKLYTFRLPVKYDPDAGYTHIVEFFNEVLHPNDINTMQELFGYVLYAGYPAHKAMWWLGKGRNGKTTAGSLLTALVGIENTAGVPLKQLDGGHRFAVARLFSKLVNIIAEPETKSAMQTPTFKAATGGDTIFGEWKNVQTAFPFVNFAKFVIYANRVPKIEDSSFAFWERVIAIDFPHTFTKSEAKKDYHKTLIAEDSLAGLLNWALTGLKRLQEHGWEFTETQTQIEAKMNMRRQSQPVKMFLDEWTEFDNRGDIPKASLFEAFRIYCDVYALLVPDESGFTRELKRNTNLQIKRQNMEEWDISSRVLCWRGLKIRNDIDVVIGHIKTEEEGNDGTDDINERNIALKRCGLLEYLMCQGSQTSHTFSLLRKVIGERKVIIENKEWIPLIEKLCENTPDFPDQSDISHFTKVEIPLNDEQDVKETPTPFVNINDLDENGNVKPDKKDDNEFQAKQSREARERLKKKG